MTYLGDENSGVAGSERHAGVIGTTDDAEAHGTARLDESDILKIQVLCTEDQSLEYLVE